MVRYHAGREQFFVLGSSPGTITFIYFFSPPDKGREITPPLARALARGRPPSGPRAGGLGRGQGDGLGLGANGKIYDFLTYYRGDIRTLISSNSKLQGIYVL